MVDLTAIILTKNEELNLRKCIESFRGIARRFVIIDSYSTDRTKELCRIIKEELMQKNSDLDFYENPWIDYATQLNWGLYHTNITTKWTMRIDADEELTNELADEIDRKLDTLKGNINGVIIKRRVYFMGRWIKHGAKYPELLLRIFRTGFGSCESKIMDEHIILSQGETLIFKYDLVDNNNKSLEWWINKHNWYSNREVLDHQKTLENKNTEKVVENSISSKQARFKRKIKNNGYYRLPMFSRSHLYFIYRYYIKLGFLDGTEGKIYHFLQAYWYRFLVDAKLYEHQNKGIKIKPQGDLKA